MGDRCRAMGVGYGDGETGRLGDWETGGLGDLGTGRLGDWETR